MELYGCLLLLQRRNLRAPGTRLAINGSKVMAGADHERPDGAEVLHIRRVVVSRVGSRKSVSAPAKSVMMRLASETQLEGE